MKFEYRISKDKKVLIYRIFNDKKEIAIFLDRCADVLIEFIQGLYSINFVQCIDNDLYIYAVISDFGVLQEISEESIHELWEDFI